MHGGGETENGRPPFFDLLSFLFSFLFFFDTCFDYSRICCFFLLFCVLNSPLARCQSQSLRVCIAGLGVWGWARTTAQFSVICPFLYKLRRKTALETNKFLRMHALMLGLLSCTRFLSSLLFLSVGSFELAMLIVFFCQP